MRQTGVEPATMGLLLFEASVCNVKHGIYKVYKIEVVYVGLWYVRGDKSEETSINNQAAGSWQWENMMLASY